MKKYRLGMIMAVFALIAMLPLRASATELAGTAQPAVTLDSRIEEKAKVHEARSDNNILNVYVAGTEALFENDTLSVGNISMKGADGQNVKIYIKESSLWVVRAGAQTEPWLQSWTEAEETSQSEETPVEWTRNADNSLSVKISLANATGEAISTFRLKLDVEAGMAPENPDDPNAPVDPNAPTVPDLPPHRIDLTEGQGRFSAKEMQELVEINKKTDVEIHTQEGVIFRFAKGSMRMLDRDEYPFTVKLITDFSKSGIKGKNVTEDIFACRINYDYSGELPGPATITIPVDGRWNGRSLYYYQVMPDGTLKYTGKSGKADMGAFVVSQTHCSDYVLLAKSTEELAVYSPTKTTYTSARTGDSNSFLLFAVLCIGACAAGISAVAVRRKGR